jgi:hypothetical protein
MMLYSLKTLKPYTLQGKEPQQIKNVNSISFAIRAADRVL